ncbi:hypothetical protein CCR75_008591 [Bremia lactucae]|nr:hypothetical protein CCR75_008591 [Bremia lactucae]
MANAFAVGDVDGDGASELVFGSLTGKVTIFKIEEDYLTQWRVCEVNGSVTSICLDFGVVKDTKEHCRIIVAIAEAKCFVFSVVDGAEGLPLRSEFNVALNICDMMHSNNELIIATRDGRVLFYRLNPNHTDRDELEYSQVAKVEISVEIESLIALPAAIDAPARLLARCFSGDIFQIDKIHSDDTRTTSRWNGPQFDSSGITFVVGGIELEMVKGLTALVSINGLVSLFSSSGQKQWDFQVPEAIVNAGKLEMTARGGGRQDAIVVCTWSGQVYAIQSERRLVHFRMLLPSCSIICGKLVKPKTTNNNTSSVNFQDSTARVDPTIIGISTSGIIFIYRNVQETLMRGLEDADLADKVKESAVFAHMDTPEKRKLLWKKLHDTFPEFKEPAKYKIPTVYELIKSMVAIEIKN